MNTQEIKNLKYRYLAWLYKTVKEELDRIERKFTQVAIDRIIDQHISRNAHLSEINDAPKFRSLSQAWKEYIDKKEIDGKALKYEGDKMRAEYYFLVLKLEAVEKVIRKDFSEQILKNIRQSYEDEMLKRIWESREH